MFDPQFPNGRPNIARMILEAEYTQRKDRLKELYEELDSVNEQIGIMRDSIEDIKKMAGIID